MIKRTLIGAALLALLASVILLMTAEDYTVVAEASLPIRRVPNLGFTPSNTMATLGAGDTAVVVGCVDYKTDIALEVRVQDGQVGYVSDGEFRLRRGDHSFNYLLSDPERLVWSCRNFFAARKARG